MKKIGFIDYYISEWHANNYPVWIKEVNDAMGEDFVVKYAYAEENVSLVDGKTTDEWCAEFGVEKCESIKELCEKSDYVLLLAPSNPETHLRLASEALKYGKRTYIDKTFAPDYKTAKEIFDIAEKYGTPFFSTSALRLSTETDGLKDCVSAVFTGGGGNFEEYIIHQIEMAVKVMGKGAKRVKTENQKNSNVCRIDYGNDRAVTLNFACAFPFTVASSDKNGNCEYHNIVSDYFKLLMRRILEFYNTGKAFFDTEETLEVMKIREKLIEGKQKEGEWLSL